MIVLAPQDAGETDLGSLVAAAHSSRTSVQVVSVPANAALQEFCRRTNGHFHQVHDAAAIEERISMTYLNLLARYEIRYQSVCPDAAELKLRVHTPKGWGETTVPLPG
jgi:hypothetical protein